MTEPSAVVADVRADVVVLTALDLEYTAVRAHLTGVHPHTDANGTRYEIGQFRTGRCRVALALTGPGNLAAATLTTRAVAWFQPKVLIFVGVAGGLARDLALGDVVVATRVHAYHGGRAESGGFRPRPKSWPLAHGLEQDARDVARWGAWTSLLPTDTTAPAVHFKPLVAGEVVLDTSDGLIATVIRDHYSDAVAIDMESAGVAEAAHHNDFHQTITVRAISDRADGNKQTTDSAGWQHTAAANAAAFAVALAERITAGTGSTRPVGASPYQGLTAFREADAERFFGRTETADELAALVCTRRFVAVVGRSGSGKSSLVNAGLVPLMRQRNWAIAMFRPLPGVPATVALAGGLLPLLRPELDRTEALPHRAVVADAIAGGRLAEVVGDVLAATGASRLLVCVDQFEELVAWREDAAKELAGLLVWLATGPAAANVVLTVRADTLDVAVHRLDLGAVTRNSVFLLTPMTAEQLREAVEGPIRSTGVRFEPGLATRILDAAREAPAALTLTQFALTRLWDEQDHGRLTHHAFDSFGGVSGALASYAEQVWAQWLDGTQQVQARRLLVQLVRPEADGDTIVRRTARGSELAPDLIPLAMHLATSRLLVTGTDATGQITVDLAHAALATHWQRLRGWLVEERDFRAWQEDLRESVRRAEPLRGARLAAASRWLRAHPQGISDPEREFVLVSRRRARLRTTAWRGLLAIIVVLLVVAGTFAVNLGRRTDELAGQLSRNAALLLVGEAEERLDTEPAAAAMLSVAAYRSSQEPGVLSNLAGEFQRYRSTDQVLDPGVGEVVDVAVSADGRTIAAAGPRGAAVFRMDRRPPEVTRYPGDVKQVALSQDGGLLASTTARGRIELRERDGRARVLLDVDREHFSPERLLFDDRGERLLTVAAGRLIAWDVARGRELALPAGASAAAREWPANRVWFGPDGDGIAIATGDGLVIWPLDGSPAQVVPLPPSDDVLVSGDGRTAITCADYTPVYWDLVSMRERERRPTSSDLACLHPDDTAVDHHGRVLTTNPYREADSHAHDARSLEDVAAGSARVVVPSPARGLGVLPGLAAVSDGTRLVTAVGTNVFVVDVAAADFSPMNDIVSSESIFSPDLRYLLGQTFGTRPTLDLWDTATGDASARVPVPDGLTPLGFVAGGTRVLALDREVRSVTVFDVPSLRVVGRIELPTEMTEDEVRDRFHRICVVDLPDTDEVAVVHAGLAVRLDVRSATTSGTPHRLGRTEKELQTLAEADACTGRQDRGQVAFGTDSRVEIRDLERGERTTLPVDDVGPISDLRFTEDGQKLAVMGHNGSLVVWDVQRRRPISRPQRVIAGADPEIAGFPAANQVVVRDLERLRVWDLDRNAVIVDVKTASAGTGVVTPDGDTLAYWNEAGINRIPLDPERWANHVCGVVGRDLTDAERRILPPGSHTGRIC